MKRINLIVANGLSKSNLCKIGLKNTEGNADSFCNSENVSSSNLFNFEDKWKVP